MFSALECHVFFKRIFVEGNKETFLFKIVEPVVKGFGDDVTFLTENDVSFAFKHNFDGICREFELSRPAWIPCKNG